ncbi:hypothetical protein BN2497_4381 [Janthinobacterium sp. CG23_2]|nr:hypothetical protein BN2497_4381 [Janthinobacterium sp. CG23_2]CUU28588.1 hypothetical protein BN3177_4381 [Janthinobacterium sp. CG23_2]
MPISTSLHYAGRYWRRRPCGPLHSSPVPFEKDDRVSLKARHPRNRQFHHTDKGKRHGNSE